MAYIQSTITATGSNPISGPNLIAMGGLQIIYTGSNIAFSGGGGVAGTVNNYVTIFSGQDTGIAGYVPVFRENTTGFIESLIYQTENSVGINRIPIQEHILDISGAVSITNSSSNYVLEGTGSIDTYLQLNVSNKSSHVDASSDIVVTNDIGTDTDNYVNFGINSSNYTGQFIGNSGDGYMYSNAGDFYIGNVVTGKKVYIFAEHPIYSGIQATMTLQNDRVGVNNIDPQYHLDVNGSGNFTLGIGTTSISLIKTSTPQEAPGANYNNIYMDNYANRGILSYVNERGIGKMIQNTLALENVHCFSPNTTTTMSLVGTAATSAGTLSHPTAFDAITGAGYCTNFVSAAATNDQIMGMQSTAIPFFLTSGITGVSAGFFYAVQFNWPDRSGLYQTATGLNTGMRFFAGMTSATTVALSVNLPWPAAGLLGFQMIRSTGVSGRFDETYKFVSKEAGATAPFYIEDTRCPFSPRENVAMYIYAKNDFRNGIDWMIRRIDPWNGQIYTGRFTGNYQELPKVTAGAQTLLKPTIGFHRVSGATRNIRLKGMYCETV